MLTDDSNADNGMVEAGVDGILVRILKFQMLKFFEVLLCLWDLGFLWLWLVDTSFWLDFTKSITVTDDNIYDNVDYGRGF